MINPNALEEAAKLDQLWEQGTILGPLHGMTALVFSPVSYVAPAREISIVALRWELNGYLEMQLAASLLPV